MVKLYHKGSTMSSLNFIPRIGLSKADTVEIRPGLSLVSLQAVQYHSGNSYQFF